MAVDQMLLDQAGASPDALPTLRFYRWKPATLSLGYFQTLESRNSHLASSGLDVVRRTTGGGAIVHDRELTYSLTLPLADRWAAAHRLLYDLVHQAIIAVLDQYGIVAGQYVRGSDWRDPASDRDFLCFLRRTQGDIVLKGYKVGGSAQRRSATALLQHGSILLGKSGYAPELPGICDLSIRSPDDKSLISGIIKELSAKLDVEPEIPDQTDWECKTTRNWQLSRFGNDGWTGKR